MLLSENKFSPSPLTNIGDEFLLKKILNSFKLGPFLQIYKVYFQLWILAPSVVSSRNESCRNKCLRCLEPLPNEQSNSNMQRVLLKCLKSLKHFVDLLWKIVPKIVLKMLGIFPKQRHVIAMSKTAYKSCSQSIAYKPWNLFYLFFCIALIVLKNLDGLSPQNSIQDYCF